MPSLTIDYRDESERLVVEQVLAYLGELRRVAQEAPDGTVLDACEKVALTDGRALLRTTLAAALDSRITASEQKGGRRAFVPRRTPAAPRGVTPVPS
jgi:hypothetical protein